MINFIVTITKDKVRDPLTREFMWTAEDNSRRYVASGFSRSDALERIRRRIVVDHNVCAHILIVH